jgi:NAD(P)-dependent dehydrogenase (short-subunit alcohol dehydrogenase family)
MTTFSRKVQTMYAAAIFLMCVLEASSFVLRAERIRTKISTRISSTSAPLSTSSKTKGKLLVLGGTGFLGQTICRRALLEGYKVTSLSRRGLPPVTNDEKIEQRSNTSKVGSIDFRKGDARKIDVISSILQEGGYVGVVHCIGLLLDDASGLGTYNRFISGSGSVPDDNSSYDGITRVTAFNAIDATTQFIKENGSPLGNEGGDVRFPFVFTSAAEAGWPDVRGGPQVEKLLAPEWLQRYLAAKRAVEARLLNTNDEQQKGSSLLRPIIVRPSLIYSLDKPASYAPVGAFFVGNKLGLPFVDRPVTVQSLANAVVKSISQESTVEGILRYPEIDSLNQ